MTATRVPSGSFQSYKPSRRTRLRWWWHGVKRELAWQRRSLGWKIDNIKYGVSRTVRMLLSGTIVVSVNEDDIALGHRQSSQSDPLGLAASRAWDALAEHPNSLFIGNAAITAYYDDRWERWTTFGDGIEKFQRASTAGMELHPTTFRLRRQYSGKHSPYSNY